MKKYILLLLVLFFTISTVFAQNKTALVIGNGAYSHFPRLSHPKNEAIDMKNALRRLDFEVILLLDGTEDQIVDAIADFEARLQQRGGLALFHYGGHGVQVNGANYIIPVDADIPDERRVKSRAVDIDEIIAALDASGSKTNIVILDACRDNPLPGGSRSGTRGLAVVGNQPPDSVIVYSADAGTTAQDGLFTPTLLKYIETPGLEFYDLLKKVRTDVRTASGGKQRTGDYNQLESDIYLAGTGSAPVRTPGFVEEAAKYGSVKVSVVEAGTVYIDGVRMGNLSSNRSATLSDITTGIHQLEIRYGSKTERKSITVYENRIASAGFTWVDPSTVAMSNRDSISLSDGAGDNFVLVRGGTFQMGSTSGGSDEAPVHSVTVSSFYISKYEVTQKEWQNVMGSSVKEQRDKANPDWPMKGEGNNNPMYFVSWNEAVEYCNKLSRNDGLAPVYSGSGDNILMNKNANGYRLPTEAEWEYAAQGGNSSRGYTYSGSNTIGNVGWYSSNSGYENHPVGGKQANELGLYDMSGNVYEWCWDWIGDYSSGSQTDPTGASPGSYRVFRGGSWDYDASYSRSADRIGYVPAGRYYDLGFRVVRRP